MGATLGWDGRPDVGENPPDEVSPTARLDAARPPFQDQSGGSIGRFSNVGESCGTGGFLRPSSLCQSRPDSNEGIE